MYLLVYSYAMSPRSRTQAPHPGGDYMTVAEAAAYIRTTPRTIRAWIADGRLPVHRFSPKVIRVRQSELEALGQPAT